MERRLLRFGSCWGPITSDRPEYILEVTWVFGAELIDHPPESSGPPRFALHLAQPELPLADWNPGPLSEHLLVEQGDGRVRITTGALIAELRHDLPVPEIRIQVRFPDLSCFELRVHLSVVLNKLLFFLDHLVLHAAAVEIHGRVCLFVGEKGAGKSTTCLGLARAGGTVLGEDHVILRRTPAGFLVSGGDDRSRLTEQTERHFFARPLEVVPRDFAGTWKKEIRMGDHFLSRPYEDLPPGALFFPAVARRLELRRLKAQPALLRLIRYTAQFQRFAGGEDQKLFLDYLLQFIRSVPAFELDLSPDLADLDRLPGELARV